MMLVNGMFSTSKATSLPDMRFDSLDGDVFDIFTYTPITEGPNVTTLNFPNVGPSNIVQGLFFQTAISDPSRFKILTGGAPIPLCFSDALVEDAKAVNYLKNSPAEFRQEDLQPYAPFRVSAYQRFMRGPTVKNIHGLVDTARRMGFKYPPLVFYTPGGHSSRMDVRVRHVPYISPLELPTQFFYEHTDTPLARFGQSTNLTAKSVNNLLRTIYDSRLENKTKTQEIVILNLQPFGERAVSGIYRNSNKPRSSKEILYKLIENPDQEDINQYIPLYPSNISRKKRASIEISFSFSTSSANEEVTFNVRRLSNASAPVTIYYGDGGSERVAFNDMLSDVISLVPVKHTYATAGTYTVKMVYDHSYDTGFAAGGTILDSATSVTLNMSVPSSGYRFFYNKSNLETIRFNTDRNEMFVCSIFPREMFRNCPSLRTIDPFVCNFNEGDANNMFLNTGNLESVVLLYMNRTFSIANNKLDGAALNALFEGLAPVATPQTVTVTGNPGVLESTYDPSIATAKGWTVID